MSISHLSDGSYSKAQGSFHFTDIATPSTTTISTIDTFVTPSYSSTPVVGPLYKFSGHPDYLQYNDATKDTLVDIDGWISVQAASTASFVSARLLVTEEPSGTSTPLAQSIVTGYAPTTGCVCLPVCAKGIKLSDANKLRIQLANRTGTDNLKVLSMGLHVR